MNCKELKKTLQEAKIPEWSYNLKGTGLRDNQYVLAYEKGKWHCFYYERGREHQEKWFETEEEACTWMMGKLIPEKKTIDEPLPLGTIVRLHEGKMKLMIVSRALRVPAKDGKQYYFDYGAVSYPQGLISTNMAYFQQDAVAEVLHWGYSDADDLAILESIHYFLDTHPDMPRGSANNF